ncbi:MAG: response regulator [Verrucomicrobia bacterium]|nr:response regulator [Verrucomicrobiota bacterium]
MSDEVAPARTMRINLAASRKRKGAGGRTVTIRQPSSGVGATSFGRQSQEEMAGISSSPYERLLQSIYDAVLITDSEGAVLECNHRAVDFLQYSQEELQAMPVTRLLCGVDDSVLASIRKNLLAHRYTLIEGSCRRKDGGTFPSEIAVNRLDLDPTGRLCFFIRDISVRKRAQDALEEAVSKLEEHDRNRSQFISNVSHELRTPLTSMIYAIANMLKGVVGPLSDHAAKYLEMLQGDCKRLLMTVNDILDLRKIESHTLTLAKTRVPYGRLVRRSAETLAVQAEQKSIDFRIETGTGLWFVNCDAQKIERVVLNLVGNATKFTPDGGHVHVSVSQDEARPGFVCVTVDDDGIGIPKDAVTRVTERYFTVGDQPSGSGLGLAISKEIVEMHDGVLSVESPVPGADKGTRISFCLPTVEPPMVLIVDDDPDVLRALDEQIVEHGYRVLAARGGQEALELVESESPDIIILDLVLPDIPGRDVIVRLKADSATVRIPIVVLTGAHLDQAAGNVLRNFGIPALSKPWDEGKLLDSVAGAFLASAPFVSH